MKLGHLFSTHRPWLGSLVICAISIGAAGACSGSGTRHDDTFGESGGSSATGTTGASVSTAQGGGATSGGFSTGSSGSGVGVGGGCAGTSIKAEKMPLDMYIMLDQSSSMDDPASGGTKWTAVTQALQAFIQQPESTGIGVGLQYFGLPPGGAVCPFECFSDSDCGACGPCFGAFGGIPGFCFGSGDDSCNAADYSKPEIEIATLPGVASSITASIGNHGPSTSTPTAPALQGAVDHAKAWSAMHPDHVVIAVLATDGDPTECDTDLNHIDSIASAALAGSPKVSTYVIGVGPSLTALNGIAAAGGTGSAYLVDTNANAQQQFLDAMNSIQGKALGCSYTIPAPQMGTLDYGQVNVQYTPGGGGTSQTFTKVDDQAACPASGDAWYYDDNAHPTKIILCDGTCSKVSVDTTGAINIVLGCASIVN